VETQCGRKPPAASHLNLLFNKKILLQYFCTGAVLYQYAGFYLQRATTLLSFSRLSWKGATTPFALVLADVLVRRRWPTIFSLLGTPFHTFSDWIHLKHNT